jgi:hypothetical protein
MRGLLRTLPFRQGRSREHSCAGSGIPGSRSPAYPWEKGKREIAIAGVGDKVKPVVDSILGKLTTLAG